MIVGSAIVPALFGAGGYSLGGSAGIAALGTAASASWPLAAVGALVGTSAVCSVESAEGVRIRPLCTRFRSAVERIQRWNLGRESEDRDH